MASSSDLPSPFLPQMSDFSQIHNLFSTAGDMKFHLQSLLDNKEKQLQQAATLGQRVLAQQMELDERIRQLQELEVDKTDDGQVNDLARDRFCELADALASWDKENAQLSSAFASLKRFPNGKPTSPSIKFAELPREEPERSRPSAGTSAAQTRRAKNAAHRADDVEFAFEIGSGLLTEVRRLQSLLGERDKAIQDMKEEKDDLEKSLESLQSALRQQEQSADKYKEENWNLEVSLQELRSQYSDSQSATLRLESDNKRLTKLLSGARDAGDQHKNESDRLANAVEEMKSKHETDIAQARRHAAGLAREKSDLQQTIDTLKKEAARSGRRLPRFGSPSTPNGGFDDSFAITPANDDGATDIFTGASTNRKKLDPNAFAIADDMDEFLNSPDISPVRQQFLSPNHPKNEIEALQQRLAHAQRQINTLKGSLQREKQLKVEYRSKLDASPGVSSYTEADEEEEGDEDADDTLDGKHKSRRGTPFKAGGRGRGRGRGRERGGMTLMEKFTAVSPATVYDDNGEWPLSSDRLDSPPAVPPIPIQLSQAGDEDEKEAEQAEYLRRPRSTEGSRSPSPSGGLESHSNRTSVDGMDPAFANVLKRRPSNGSTTHAGSPLRLSVLNASASSRPRGGLAALGIGRRSRGGVPYKETRPPSFVGAPDVLSAELLGMDSSPLRNNELLAEIDESGITRLEDEEVAEIETTEAGCQTEALLEVLEREEKRLAMMLEIGVQYDPDDSGTPVVTRASSADQETQTDTKEAVLVQSVPLYADSSAGTDPEPEPESITTPTAILMQAETQTLLTEKADADTQTVSEPTEPDDGEFRHRRTTITQWNSSFAGETTLRGGVDIGVENEIGPETETEMDDYHDARQSLGTISPHASESRDDFHSIMTVTDNDFSESEEQHDEDIGTTISREQDISIVGEAQSRETVTVVAFPPTVYEDVGVTADFKPEPERIVERVVERIEIPPPVIPKPDLKDISVQTEETTPEVTTVFSTHAHPAALTPGLYRVGSTMPNHHFQFVAPTAPGNMNASNDVNAVPLSPASVPFAAGPLTSLLNKESRGTFPRMKHAPSPDRRQSMESALPPLSAADLERNRPRVQSAATAVLSSLDKTKPPMMLLPPPPKVPPPSSMPPPSFIPERRIPGGSSGADVPPPRPSSPPPPELIQRATTPTFGTALSVPGQQKGSFAYRQPGASMPPSLTGLRQPPSTSSFKSAANAAVHASHFSPIAIRDKERREISQSSLMSDRSGVASPRSSISSEHRLGVSGYPRDPTTPSKLVPGVAHTHHRPLSVSEPSGGSGPATDPAIIHAITQTMIGEFMYKYTRRAIGKGHGERRHKRYFWVHPYTKTLYWSSADPGSTIVSESSAKSAYIEGVRSVLDPNPMPPGLYQYSVIVSTPQREMKITAPTKERHEIWYNALKYLLARPSALGLGALNSVPQSSPTSQDFTDDDYRLGRMNGTPQSQRSARSAHNTDTWNHTPRGQRSRSQLSMRGSIKRSNTPAAEYLKWNGVDSPYSPTKSFVDVSPPAEEGGEDLDFELHQASLSDGYEGLENVRACCDGRHTVGRSGVHENQNRRHHHNNHHHHIQSQKEKHIEHIIRDPITRPISPAWSFRSRTGSTHSNEGGPISIFSWGRADGKLRFGSKRSARTVPSGD